MTSVDPTTTATARPRAFSEALSEEVPWEMGSNRNRSNETMYVVAILGSPEAVICCYETLGVLSVVPCIPQYVLLSV